MSVRNRWAAASYSGKCCSSMLRRSCSKITGSIRIYCVLSGGWEVRRMLVRRTGLILSVRDSADSVASYEGRLSHAIRPDGNAIGQRKRNGSAKCSGGSRPLPCNGRVTSAIWNERVGYLRWWPQLQVVRMLSLQAATAQPQLCLKAENRSFGSTNRLQNAFVHQRGYKARPTLANSHVPPAFPQPARR